ncbi:MAG: tetratricopeptide repeat protein [Anaerolineae bacterium]|nr:MAG: tetratricopeptide repeat protein [Anaerolineae bacterium]
MKSNKIALVRFFQSRWFWGFVFVAVAIPLLYANLRPISESPSSQTNSPTATLIPNDELVLLLAKVDREGWTPAYRQAYARLMTEQGNLPAVNAFISVTTDLTVDDLPILWRLSEDALSQRDWSTATTHLQQILQLNPQDARASYQLALLLATEAPSEAVPYLEQAALSTEYADQVRTIQGVLAQFSNEPTPEDWRTLGLVCMDLVEWGCAERAFSAALTMDSLDWQSYVYRGYVRDQIAGDGLTDLETALALNPSGLTYYFLGLHYRKIEQNLQAARDVLAQAYALDPTNPALAAELGSTYQESSEYAAAENWYSLAVSLAPEDVRWQRLRAAFYADANFQLDEVGLAAIQEAYALAPRDVDILTSMGAAYFWLFDREQARSFLQQALTIEPNNPRTRYYFALQLEREGDTQGALDSLTFVVQTLGPDTGFGLLAAREIQRLSR